MSDLSQALQKLDAGEPITDSEVEALTLAIAPMLLTTDDVFAALRDSLSQVPPEEPTP